ncbi:phosphoribosyl-ATP diphosphatase [Singulisphaera sp. PoT]|uniref:phosphoribosyl-ATP diphosphatase n=1 Tax=Singulisphaera sp. PoT TaxID=3411797 RepID=UPI003BF6031F
MSNPSMIHALMALIAERKANPPAERSYVVSLIQSGDAKILGKIAEETAEVIEAAAEPGEEGRAHLVKEAADLIFHALVLLGRHDVAWGDVEAELARRFGISGIVEKESRASK